MSIFAEFDDRFANLEKKVGVFIGVAVLVIILVFIGIFVKQDLFLRTTTLYFQTGSAVSLYESMPVTMRGFKIGKVDQITLEPGATVKVKLEINNDYMHFVTQGSIVHLIGKSLFDDGTLQIRTHHLTAVPVEADAVLPFEREPGMGDIATKLFKDIEPILADVQRLTTSINDPKGDIHQILVKLNQTSGQLADTTAHLDTLVQRAETTVQSNGLKLTKVLDASHSAVTQLDGSLHITLQKADAVLDNLQATTSDIRKLAASSVEEVPPMLQEGRATVEDTREIVDSAKKSWPIRNMIEPAREQSLPSDSYSPPAR
jgi:phospholipid/cholesterol/gamma-HCH transport system substrate-binding protein